MIYITSQIIGHSITSIRNMSKYINQYNADVVDKCQLHKVSDQTKTHYNFIDDITINKHSTICTNDNSNVTKINKLVNVHGSNHFTKKIKHTSNITNNITRHTNNNYGNNVTKQISKHRTRIINYITEEILIIIKPSHNKTHCNFYNDTYNTRQVIQTTSQPTHIVNNTTETNT